MQTEENQIQPVGLKVKKRVSSGNLLTNSMAVFVSNNF